MSTRTHDYGRQNAASDDDEDYGGGYYGGYGGYGNDSEGESGG